jgi:hypothetical protein
MIMNGPVLTVFTSGWYSLIMSLTPLDVLLEVKVDSASWAMTKPPRACPPEILALVSGGRLTSIDAVLLWIAYCTRPPESSGFSLSDLWAWLRYRPALEDGPVLRLCRPWTAIDSHQKTILSDDFGMGFAVEMLVNSLQIQDIADTHYVLDVAGNSVFKLGETGKRGPKKSPDFLMTHVDHSVSVLECKGTQTSRKALAKALGDGVKQKQNISQKNGKLFKHTLVAGLFVPQSENRTAALLEIRDPEPEDLSRIVANIPTEVLHLSILQISLAKQLNLMGLHSWAYVLATTTTERLDQATFPDFIDPPVQLENGSPRFTQVYFPPAISRTQNEGASAISFEMTLSANVYEVLRNSENVGAALSLLRQFKGQRAWKFTQEGGRSRLESPLGFTLSLEYR